MISSRLDTKALTLAPLLPSPARHSVTMGLDSLSAAILGLNGFYTVHCILGMFQTSELSLLAMESWIKLSGCLVNHVNLEIWVKVSVSPQHLSVCLVHENIRNGHWGTLWWWKQMKRNSRLTFTFIKCSEWLRTYHEAVFSISALPNSHCYCVLRKEVMKLIYR